MLYGPRIKEISEEVRSVLPTYIFEVSDINEALDPNIRGGNCAAISYMVLLAIQDSLGDVPSLDLRFGFSPHELRECGTLVVGHALARVQIGEEHTFIDQSRDGSLLIGLEGSLIKIPEDTVFYGVQEGYELFISELYGMSLDSPPEVNPVDVLAVYKSCLEELN